MTESNVNMTRNEAHLLGGLYEITLRNRGRENANEPSWTRKSDWQIQSRRDLVGQTNEEVCMWVEEGTIINVSVNRDKVKMVGRLSEWVKNYNKRKEVLPLLGMVHAKWPKK